MLSEIGKDPATRLLRPLIGLLSRSRIDPNLLTIFGLLLNIAVGAVLAAGELRIGGVLVLVAGLFDMLDGAVARATGRTTTFGAFLDSTLDRYSEAAILGGLLIAQLQGAAFAEPILIYIAIVGSMMVSYARARAEGLGLRGESGWLARPERLILLAVGLMLGLTTLVLWILAVLTNLTAIQRILFVWRQTSAKP